MLFACRFDRKCTSGIEYDEVKIPEGMLVSVPIMVLHRDPVVWPEPEKFNPLRYFFLICYLGFLNYIVFFFRI